MNSRKRCVDLVGLVLAALSLSAPHTRAALPPAAAEILTASGVKGGLVVHLNCGGGTLTGDLRAGAAFVVQGLDANPANVADARDHLRSRKLTGPVSVDRLAGETLPYIDGLVNLVVVSGTSPVPGAELIRVLAPGGVALVEDGRCQVSGVRQEGVEVGGKRWLRLTKPRPDNIDEWTHYLHDASNNAVAHDTVVGPPRRLQWTGSPRWARHHDRMASMSALVSTHGRIFYIMDEGPRGNMLLPPTWRLVARDGFNGSPLWSRTIPNWHFHLWPLKSGPAQLPRRLVAAGEEVYVTLGLHAPVTALDAATGEDLRVYADTAGTEELVLSEGVLFLMVNPDPGEEPFQPDRSGVWNDTRRVDKESVWDTKMKRRMMAVNAASGRILWTHEDKIAPLTLAADGERVCYHDGESLVALGRQDGARLWRSEPTGRRRTFPVSFAPTLVVHGDVVLFAGGDNKMTAVSTRDGKTLWSAKHHPSGHHSPRDLLVVGGLAWSGAIAGGSQSGVFTGHDLLTGEVKSEFAPDVETYWFHHRCYRSKATDRYLLPSRTGIEFVDFRKKQWEPHHWVRGGCIYGIMPCNGLVYTPPHACACYLESKLSGFNALAPAHAGVSSTEGRLRGGERLEQGPAFAKVATSAAARPSTLPTPSDWPTYRHDPARSGATASVVPPALVEAWQTALGGKLTSVVVADSHLFVASTDTHTLHALDTQTGRVVWSYVAGGRVDSPPTLDGDRVLFGSADGWVYCLRGEDGSLVWRFRAAPSEARTMAYEQLESLWPLPGSVLVRDGVVHCVAGRSMFLDGGLRLLRLDAATGRELSEVVLDERDPQTGENLQQRVQVLNMPVALPDVLSCDDRYLYMRSQRLELNGERTEATPAPTEPATLAGEQQGADRHLFSPAGFLDDSWFHRSYWVFGRRYSSGCNWWHRAGHFAPAGRLLVFTDTTVYGYGRKPAYYQWTVPLDYHLFACAKDPKAINTPPAGESEITVAKSASLNPKGKPLTVMAWVKPSHPDGVVLVRGGASHGYGLMLSKGKPRFVLRRDNQLHTVEADGALGADWAHLAGVLAPDGALQLFVDGELRGTARAPGLITADPAEAMQIGTDQGSPLGTYERDQAPDFKGAIDEVRVYHAALIAEDIRVAGSGGVPDANAAALVLRFSFDQGDARDDSGNANHGGVGAKPTEGKRGKAMAFVGTKGGRKDGGVTRSRTPFPYAWSNDCPILTRAMVLAGETLFVAGPLDTLDEEEAYRRWRDPDMQEQLTQQLEAIEGKHGALLLAVSAKDGRELARYDLPAPPAWDSMAATPGRLYLTTIDGKVLCMRAKE